MANYKKEKGCPKLNASDSSKQFEDLIERIFTIEGYTTSRRAGLADKKGKKSEIDILAKITSKDYDEIIAIECKDSDSSITVEKIRDFKCKLDNLKIKNGLIVINKELSD